MSEVTVCVVGASGYTGAETLRWCLQHPRLRVVGATSRQHAGRTLRDLWPQLDVDVPITDTPVPADVAFLCLPHGEAAKLAPTLPHRILIDLSGDHRLPEPLHTATYGFTRGTDPWPYGLVESAAAPGPGSTRVANPGCFASALALAILPFVGALPERISVVGLTGSTGSGVTPTAGTHHPSRAENLRPYKVLGHQHVPEVLQVTGGGYALDFVPISAPLRRGILVTATLPGATLAQARTYYAGHPLVRVVDGAPELHHVLGTGRADVGVVTQGGTSAVFCAIDNLGRGAGAQAVANLNRVMGWPVDLGLRIPGWVP